jgi:hypothetical protein
VSTAESIETERRKERRGEERQIESWWKVEMESAPTGEKEGLGIPGRGPEGT